MSFTTSTHALSSPPHGLPYAVHTVGLTPDLPPVPTGHRDHMAGGLHPRPRDDAFVYCIPQHKVHVVLPSEIPDARDARHEGPPREISGLEDDEGIGTPGRSPQWDRGPHPLSDAHGRR